MESGSRILAVAAGADARGLPPATPPARLFLAQHEWNALSDKLADPFFATVAEHCRRFVREFPAKVRSSLVDVPRSLDETEGRNECEARVLKAVLQRSAVVWYLDRDPAALELARQATDVLCTHMPWTPLYLAGSAEADLHTADLTYCAAFALDVLGGALGEAAVAALVAALRDKGLRPYLRGLEKRNWWRHAEFNWGTAMHGQAGLGALAIEPYEPELAAEVLPEAKAGVQYVLEYFQPGGGWIEGMMYQCTTMGHLIDFAVPLSRVKGDDLGLLRRRNLHDAFESRLQMVGGDGRPYNFSDCPADTVEWYLPHAYWFARHLNRPDWAAFEDAVTKGWRDLHGLFHDTETFWYREAGQATTTWQARPYYRCDGLDWHFWRGGHSWLALRGGRNGGNRGNWDLGHFILGFDRERFAFDPSHEGRETRCHNAVTVHGFPQADSAHAPVLTARHWEDGCYFCCDLQACFPHSVSHYFRHLLLIGDRHLLVLDDLLGRRGRRNSAEWHLTTRLPYEQGGAGLRVLGAEQAMRVRFLVPTSAFNVREWTYSDQPIRTFAWRDEYDKVHSVMPMLLSFDDEEPLWEHSGDRATLTLCGHRWHIDLAEGTLSVDEGRV